MHAFSQVNRTGIARSTEPVGTQSQSQNSPPLRIQVRTTIRSKNQTKIHPKALQNRAQIGPKSLPRTSQEPSGARVSPKSARKRSKRGPKRPQERPWGPTRASQERPRPPKERPEGARGLARGTSGEAKSTPSRPQKRKKSNLRKVLRDSALPTFQALRPPQIDPESAQNRPKSVPRAPRAASSIDFGRSKVPQAASARDFGRLGPPRAPPGVACRARPFAHSLSSP